MPQLEPGAKASSFQALAVGGTHDGKRVSLSDFVGQNVVLYFYPKDDTPGCTMQACGLRDAWGAVSEKCVLFGVSTDSAASHTKFITKHAALTDCKEIAFAPAAPEAVRKGTGVGERGGMVSSSSRQKKDGR